MEKEITIAIIGAVGTVASAVISNLPRIKKAHSDWKEGHNLLKFKREAIYIIVVVLLAVGILVTGYFIGRGPITNLEYYSYYADEDGNNKYISHDGIIKLKVDKERFVSGETTVNDVVIKGKPNKITWKVSGYKKDNNLHLSYGTGVAEFAFYNTDYIGYWIGENTESQLMICPYVLSKDKLDEKEALKRWNILNNSCSKFDIVKNKILVAD